ncbi:hypothetical protein F6X40_41225 [Paraburkholderia sp. UCT31]|uniref:hypothetical protein n=1 Tax=Paraburkholderia sp. UCT31 TaxID=2615209 RepID=UPI001655A52A|nr:hypothetical protein [Paraburkholderia sp. UCT31]MBC8742888.1 hypothetical protein [Paraburkholderia sp. UCT31]
MNHMRRAGNPFYRERAQRDLQGFKFTKVFGSGSSTEGTPRYEIWRCRKPGTSDLAMDIVLTPLTVSVTGDIDPLVFQVSRGLDFLAGNDIEYYIHGKLSPECKSVELDRDAMNRDRFDRLHAEVDDLHGAALAEAGIKDTDYERFADLIALAESLPEGEGEAARALEAALDLATRDESFVGTEHEYYHLLGELDLDTSDMGQITKPTDTLMTWLYLANEAARQILDDAALSATELAHAAA